MPIYTVMMWDHADTDIMLATADREEALKRIRIMCSVLAAGLGKGRSVN